MYKYLIRPILFQLKAENAHNFAAVFLRLFGLPIIRPVVRLFYPQKKSETFEVMGLKFPSRLGLAAGFDKNAAMYKGLSAIGFGFVEIGTVTPLAQPGNPKPRLFRLPKDKALINRMGFNNDGMQVVARRLKGKSGKMIVGGNIGKNKVTPNEEARSDYEKAFTALHDLVDYFVVNVSSPNTPGLRELQEKGPLLDILESLSTINKTKNKEKAILLKIAPDLSNEQLDDIIDIVKKSGIAGIIATNTTISREKLQVSEDDLNEIGNGGLSGAPLKERALEVIAYLRKRTPENTVIVGVGGISTASDAQQFIEAGADLVQIYTSFIYRGPEVVHEINTALAS